MVLGRCRTMELCPVALGTVILKLGAFIGNKKGGAPFKSCWNGTGQREMLNIDWREL